MKPTAWEQSDWTYFFLFLPYHTARRPETRFLVGWVPGRFSRPRCALEDCRRFIKASWVNCGGFEAARGVSHGARRRETEQNGSRGELAAAVRGGVYRNTGGRVGLITAV